MIDCVAECLQEVGTWAESCPCHGNDPSLAGPSRHLRVRFFGDRTGLQTCPMRTRRAPEMANNAVLRCLRQLLAIAAPSLLLMPCIAATSPIDRNAILFDFGRAKRHILLFFQVKSGHWRTLPWILAGIAHEDAAVARQCSQRALDLFATSSIQVQQHHVVNLLCAPDSPARREMERFIAHESDLAELPHLRIIAAKFRFVTVTERYVESLHASAKRCLLTAPTTVHYILHGLLLTLPYKSLFLETKRC
jgi:hypothetical protein